MRYELHIYKNISALNAWNIREIVMLISLSEIMTTKDKVVKIQAPIEMEKFEFQGDSYGFARKDPLDLIITNLGNKMVMIEGSTNISLVLFCSRCLNDIIYPMDIRISKEIDFTITEEERAESLDEMNYIIGYNLDVDILVYDEILIDFPMKLLCSEDCKGICRNCGTNLNEKTCDCDNTEYDSRMSVIRDIFNNFKEV